LGVGFGVKVWGVCFRVNDLVFGVWVSGFRVQGLGERPGLRVSQARMEPQTPNPEPKMTGPLKAT